MSIAEPIAPPVLSLPSEKSTHTDTTGILALDNIVLDESLHPREEVSAARVKYFRDAYTADDWTEEQRDAYQAAHQPVPPKHLTAESAIPPLHVVQTGDHEVLLVDGWHRHQALTDLGYTQARVRLVKRPADRTAEETAYLVGLELAAHASVPLTIAERKAAAERLMTEFPGMTVREVARRAGIGYATAHRISEVRQAEGAPRDTPATKQSAARLASTLMRCMKQMDEGRPGRIIRSTQHGVDAVVDALADAASAKFEADAADKLRMWAQWLTDAADRAGTVE